MVGASIYTRVHRGSCLGDERHPLTYVGLGRFQHGMVSVSRDRLRNELSGILCVFCLGGSI